MATDRLTTPEQLREFCWTGEEIVHGAVDGGDAERARAAYATVVDARVAMIETFKSWAASTFAFVLDGYGPEPLAAVLDPEAWTRYAQRDGFALDQSLLASELLAGTSDAGERLAALVDRGRPGEAKLLWADVEQALLRSHDFRREWVTALWARVYLDHGAEALSELLLRIGHEPAWSDFIRESAAKDLVDQVRDWAFLLCVGNFGVASITETDDEFVLHYNVCGSCGRQELDGRYEEPWCFPRVEGAIPHLNGGDPRKTVYRAHQTVLHDIVAIEVVGFPWPVIECQGPGGPGGCGMRFYKDTEQIPDGYFERVGAKRGA
jgi:hypothetical protein